MLLLASAAALHAQVGGGGQTQFANGSLAPAPPAFLAGEGAAASSTLPLPRFIADPNSAQKSFHRRI